MKQERLDYLTGKYEAKLNPSNEDEMSGKPMGGRKHGGPGGPGGPGGRGMMGGKPKNTKATLKRLFSYIAKDKWKLLIVLLCIMAGTAGNLAGSYLLRPIINGLTDTGKTGTQLLAGLIQGVFTMAVVYIVAITAQYLQSRIMVTISQDAIKRLRNELFEKLQKLPVRYYDTNNNGDVMSRFTNDVDVIGEMLNNTVVQLISGAISIIGTLSLMIYTNIWLTLITIVMVPLMLKAVSGIGKRSRKYYKAQQAAIGTMNGYIEETITGQKVVKVFNHEESAREEFDYLNQDLRGKQIRAQFFGGIMGPVMGNMGQVSYSLTAAIGGILCVLRGFDIGGLTVFVNYSRQFSRPINEVAMQVNTIFSALAGAERVFAVMDEAPEAEDVENAITIEETEDGKHYYVIPKANVFVKEHGKPEGTAHENELNYYAEVKGAVTLKDVTFGYLPDKTILKHISLYAKPGQKIAFVGSTGAGKTTITNLINRFYDIDSGQILMDGFPITQIARDSLRRNIAMVLQDTHLFTGTVRENIRYGRLDATDEEVIEAAKAARADHFIKTLPGGYQMELNEDASNVSQGQKQLLTIARAILADNKILILDEATSSVDTRTEIEIQKAMDNLMKGRTSFVIAHRLSTIRDADLILVMKDGDIIEQGRHEELLAAGGFYANLYNSQFEDVVA